MGRVRRGHARGGGPCAVPDSGSSCFQMWWAGRMRLSGAFSPRSVVGMTAGGSGASACARRWSPGLARGRAVLPARAVPVPGCPNLLRGPGACWSARGALPKRSGSADPCAARAGREGIGLFVRRRAVARATRAVVPGSAWSYLFSRRRTRKRAVVLRCARSYPGALLTYDPASQGTTPRKKVRRTTARPDVRPGAPTYDRAGPGRTEPPAPARRRPLTAAAHPDRTLEHEEPRFRTALSGRQGLARSSQAHRGPTGEGPSGAGAGAGAAVLAVPAVPARRPVLVPRGAHEADHNEWHRSKKS